MSNGKATGVAPWVVDYFVGKLRETNLFSEVVVERPSRSIHPYVQLTLSVDEQIDNPWAEHLLKIVLYIWPFFPPKADYNAQMTLEVIDPDSTRKQYIAHSGGSVKTLAVGDALPKLIQRVIANNANSLMYQLVQERERVSRDERSLVVTLSNLAGQLAEGIRAKRISQVAIMPITDSAIAQTALGSYLTDKLTLALYEKHATTLVERTELSKVLNELAATLSGPFDESTVKRVGRLVAADALLVGSYVLIGTSSLELNVKAISVETGEIVAAGGAQLPRIDLPHLSDSAPQSQNPFGDPCDAYARGSSTSRYEDEYARCMRILGK